MRRLWFRLVLFAFVLAGADYVLWQWAVNRLVEQSLLWTQQRPDGLMLKARAAALSGGWPLLARITLPEPELFVGGYPVWQGQALEVEVSPWHPLQLLMRPQGPQAALPESPWKILMQSASASVTLPVRLVWDGWWPVGLVPDTDPSMHILDLHLTAQDVRLRPDGPGWTSADPAPHPETGPPAGYDITTVSRVVMHLRLDQALAVQCNVDDVVLPPVRPWPFGKTVQHASVTARIDPFPFSNVQRRDKIRTWQAASGVFRILDATLTWGSLHASMAGQGGLDDSLQPVMQGVATMASPEETMTVLRDQGWIAPGLYMAAKTMLSLFVQATDAPESATQTGNVGYAGSARNAASYVSVPFRLADSVLMIGQIPVLKVPPPFWADRRR
ncbi:putative membrane associated protein [Granulibacter bethesdensis]|uniref:Membrane associated protein n=1 Tax=Granulibacter bethesdensis TaxID=364410 RepID=A0AAC9P7W2_9PROT|nr:DUF2125 domain-containing protein [Granulibacter bethesdensis]APH53359.1 putative membrane associated protein [Granulibacter bethesdensis]APH60936.1 putative membrane associated protein [Granulibacter bethesdensis]